MDHDRLFKELLTTFFVEFVALFLPELAEYIERDSVEFLDKEVFNDIAAGERHEVDLLVKVRFRGWGEGCFLIHVEFQASARGDFMFRMFEYFSIIHIKYKLPVYPVAIFSYDEPMRAEPDRYQINFPSRCVLDFDFTRYNSTV